MLTDSDLSRLATQYQTPLFVLDAAVMESQFRALREALPSNFAIHYSVKANPAPAVIAVFLRLGAGVEVASAGEGRLALEAGAKAEQILFAGPAKSADELQWAVAAGVGQIHLESLEELDVLAPLAVQAGSTMKVALRVNPSAHAAGGAMRMGGQPSPFGIDEELLEQVLPLIDATAGVDLIGVHQFAATQVLNADVLLQQWAHAGKLGQQFEAITGRPPQVIDVGGGLGIPLFADDVALDLEALARGCRQRLVTPASCQVIVEPGRFLVGPAGVYVCKVISVKESRGKKFVITDGGMHHHLAASGNLGQVIKRDFPVRHLPRDASKSTHHAADVAATSTQDAQICGPLCTPLDVLARSAQVNHPQPGDLIVIEQSGAYAASASPMHFLSHPAAAEILVHPTHEIVIRARGDSRQLVPPYLPVSSGGADCKPARSVEE